MYKKKLITRSIQLIALYAFIYVALSFIFSNNTIHLKVTSNVVGTTQIFYSTLPGKFSEVQSISTPLQRGENSLEFAIPSSTKYIRWDPVNGPGKFSIQSAYLSRGIFDTKLSLSTVAPYSQIAQLENRGGGILIITTPNADDPSIFFEIPTKKIATLQTFSITTISLIIFAIILGLIRYRARLEVLQAEVYRTFHEKLKLFNNLPIFVFLAVLMWFSSLTSYTISIDDELAAFRHDFGIWVAQGRWAVYLLTKYALPQPVIPYFPHIIFCLAAAASYVLVLAAHNIKFNWKAVATFPIFVAYPVWYFVAEFYANLLSVSVGLFLVSTAAYIFSGDVRAILIGKKRINNLYSLTTQALLIGTAIGAYQSYVFAFFSIGLGLIVFYSLRENIGSLQILKCISRLLLITISSVIVYYLISLSFKSTLGVETQYIDGFIRPQIFLNNPWLVSISTLKEAIKIYLGSPAIFGLSIWPLGVLLAQGILVLIYILFDKSKRVTANSMILIAIALLSCAIPFVLNILAGGALSVPYRSMVGIPYIVWLFSYLALCTNHMFVRVIAIGAVFSATFQLGVLHSTYQATKSLALEHDKALAGQIYQRIVNLSPNQHQHPTYAVDFFGAKHFTSVFPKISTSTIGSSFFDWDGGNPARIISFMRLIGYDNIRQVSINKELKLKLLEAYKDMPIWPAENSIKYVDNIFLVKLGQQP